jgi:hypothetical protein
MLGWRNSPVRCGARAAPANRSRGCLGSARSQGSPDDPEALSGDSGVEDERSQRHAGRTVLRVAGARARSGPDCHKKSRRRRQASRWYSLTLAAHLIPIFGLSRFNPERDGIDGSSGESRDEASIAVPSVQRQCHPVSFVETICAPPNRVTVRPALNPSFGRQEASSGLIFRPCSAVELGSVFAEPGASCVESARSSLFGRQGGLDARIRPRRDCDQDPSSFSMSRHCAFTGTGSGSRAKWR